MCLAIDMAQAYGVFLTAVGHNHTSLTGLASVQEHIL